MTRSDVVSEVAGELERLAAEAATVRAHLAGLHAAVSALKMQLAAVEAGRTGELPRAAEPGTPTPVVYEERG
jgi:hypothetical protein